MTTRTLKLLTASTAFIAAASAANATTIATTVTTTQVTSASVGGITVTGAGIISATGSRGIEISSTSAVSNTINVQTGGIIRSTSSAIAGIADPVTANGAVTINNSGTIATTNNAVSSIDLTGMTNAATITNAGTISGTIRLGDGTNVVSSTGTIRGNINGGANTDTVTLNGGSVTGDIALGNGANTVTASNTTITGSYTGGSGVDNVTLTNSTVTGLLNGSTGGSDVLTINGTRAHTVAASSGGIQGFETVNFDTDVTLNDGLTGVNALTVAANKTLTVNNSFSTAGGGSISNNGNIHIGSGRTVATDTFTGGAGSGITVDIASSTQAGQLRITNGGTLNGTSLTVNMGANSGYIASGTSFVVVQDVDTGATLGTVSLTNANTGVYRFSTGTNNGNVSLTVGRIATADAVAGSDAKAIATAVDRVGVSATGALRTVQSNIGQAATAADVQRIVDSLTPSIDGAGQASVNVTVDTGNQISNRLASLRGTTGVATGDAMASSHMWLQGFGSSVDQDNDGGNFGYDANSGGMSLGLDTDTLVDGMTTGMAVSYGRSTVDSKSTNNASTDIDTYVGTLYGSRVFDGGLFMNGQVGFGFNQYEMERNVAGIGTAKGDTDGYQGTAKVEVGQDFAAGGFTLTPLASLQYTYLKMDKYTETGVGNAGLTVDPDAMSTVDAGLGGQLAYAIPLTDGGTLKPSVHAKYIHHMGDRELATTSSFLGAAGTSFNTSGVEADKSSVNLGAGLLLTTVGGTDLSLNYDADIRSNLTGHTGQLKARWAF